MTSQPDTTRPAVEALAEATREWASDPDDEPFLADKMLLALLARAEKAEKERDFLRGENDKLHAQIQDDWQPIETAPKDGNCILMRWIDDVGEGPIETIDMCFWYQERWLMACECDGISRYQAGYTHWLPLPAPPKRDET